MSKTNTNLLEEEDGNINDVEGERDNGSSTFEEICCNICMNDIFENDELADVKNSEEYDLKSKLFQNLCMKYKNDHRMQTPCKHYFHTSKTL